MSTSGRTEQIGQPATQLSRTLASIHHWQQAPGMNPQELLMTLDRLIAERLWEGQTGWDGKPMTLARALVEPWPVGLGMTPERLERLYKLAEDADVDPDLVRRVKDAVIAAIPVGPRGITTGVSIRDSGGQQQYLRRRLRRDRPDLYERVLSGEFALSAAAVEAGFHKPTRCVRIDSPDEAIKALLRVFSADELRAALDRVTAPAP